MELAQPLFLFLLPLALLWVALAWRQNNTNNASGEATSPLLRHPHLAAGSLLAPPGPRLPLLLQSLAWLLLILALAQPRQVGDWLVPPPQGRDIALIIDTSLTMSIDDFEVAGRKTARLAVLKSVLAKFVAARPHDRFGLLVFGAEAATLTPPTFDHTHVLAQIERLQVGMVGENTALGDALGLALKQIRQGKLRPAIVLVSDGEPSNTGDLTPAEAVAVARQLNVAIHSIQIGSDLFAEGRDTSSATTQKTDPEPNLVDISRLTGGQHAYVKDTQDAQNAFHAIDQLEKTLARPARHRDVREWYLLPLALSGLCLLTASGLRIRRQNA